MNAAVCLGLPSIANLISRMPGGIAQGIICAALGIYKLRFGILQQCLYIC